MIVIVARAEHPTTRATLRLLWTSQMPRKRVALERNVSRDTQTAGTSRARKNVRGKKGGLEDMPNMPLDILFEVHSPRTDAS